MKTRLLLSMIMVFGFMASVAQRQYNSNWEFHYSNFIYEYDYYSQLDYTPNQVNKEFDSLHVKKASIVSTNKKGKKFTIYYAYDQGRVIKTSYLNKKGKIIKSYASSFDNSGNRLQASSFNKKGKARNQYDYKWDSNNHKTYAQQTRREKVIKYRSVWEYDANGNILNSHRYKRGGDELKYRWLYIYDSEGVKLQSQLFKGNGKLKHKWDFSCHEEGALLEKEKNKTQVCTWSEDKGKYLIKTFQRFDERGKIRKTVSTYTIADTTLIEQKTYNDKDELVYLSKFNEQRKVILSESYRKGKLIRKREYTYENGKLVNYIFTKKGKVKTEYKYVYKNGLIVSITNLRNGKQKKRTEYTHFENGLKKSVKSFNKKDELVYSSEYTYEY